jgi:glycosyltransferase involved in cell wall biosynthesis
MLLVCISVYKFFQNRYIQVICDCHTKALRRIIDNPFSKIFFSIKKRSFKSSDLCIISNDELIPDVKHLSASYFILPDPIPELNIISNKPPVVEDYCVYSNSYAVDEPYTEVTKAANKLQGKIKILCTGRIPKKLQHLKKQPFENIYFTDYLDDKEYYRLIMNAKCVLALTYDEATLLCSGYEALSLNVPLIISDSRILRHYFSDSVVFTETDSDSITNSVLFCLKHHNMIKNKMKQLKEKKLNSQKLQLMNLMQAIDTI